MQPTAITDVKELAQNMEDIVSLKNWTNRRARIYPDYNRTAWVSGQTATYSISSTDLDMWDIQGSSIWVRIQFHATSGTAPNSKSHITMPRGSFGLIDRLTIKNGAFTIQDVEHYGDYLWAQWVLHAGHTSDPSAWLWTDEDIYPDFSGTNPAAPTTGSWAKYDTKTRDDSKMFPTETNKDTEKGIWVRVPLISVLDKTAYIPMYNLGEKLQFQFKFAPDNEAVVAMIFGGAGASRADLLTLKYSITDTYLEAVGLQALEGGVLTGAPFIFTSFNVMGFSAHPNAQQVVKVNHDLKKTSVKKALTIIRPKTLKIVGADNGSTLLSTELKLHRSSAWKPSTINAKPTSTGGDLPPVQKFHGMMGGTIYPYPRPLETYHEFYNQLLRYGEQHSVFKSPSDPTKWVIKFSENYLNNIHTCDSDNENRRSAFRYFPMIFDRLDQSSTIISGQDSERYTLQQVWEASSSLDADTVFLTFYDYNVVVTISGGEIVLND